jgi:hypothetical protein
MVLNGAACVCGQVFIAMGKLKDTLHIKTWEEVTMELLKLCVPRACNGIEQEWPFQSVRDDLAKVLLTPMSASVLYRHKPEGPEGLDSRDPEPIAKRKRKKGAIDDLEDPATAADPDRTWLEDVLAMVGAVLGPLPEARVDYNVKQNVLRKCLCFALTRAATVGGKTITKWSKLRKEMKALLFREHRAVILSQPDMPKRSAKRKAPATKDGEEAATAAVACAGSPIPSGGLASRIHGEENLRLRALAAEKCTIDDADKKLISAFLVSNPPKKNIKLHPMRMQLMEAAFQETRGMGGVWGVEILLVMHRGCWIHGASALEGCLG